MPSETSLGPVLVVEDTAVVAEMLREKLHGLGFEVLLARHGGEALALLEETCPRVVLLDLVLPVQDGFKVLDAIKSQPHLASVPVVLMSAAANLAGLEHDERVKAVLRKPVTLEALLAALERVLPGLSQGNPGTGPSALPGRTAQR